LSGYLTPDSVPDEFVCRTILIPNDERWVSVVTGALNSLAEARNWQRDGDLLPEEAASAWLPRFDDFCFKTYTCEGRVIGEVVAYAGTDTPSANWLPCDGNSYLRADYPGLYGKIGTAYGAVDGTHFSIPDLRGRAILGDGQGDGLTDRAVGDSFGTETHQLITSELPSHNHADAGHSHNMPIGYGAVTAGAGVPVPIAYGVAFPVPGTYAANAAIGNTGGNGAHNNLQPALVLTYWIVAQ